jgi:hypothetical protein
MRLDITFSVGYERRRADTTDRWEARVGTVGLLIAGSAVVFLIVWLVVPRVLDALGRV